TLRVRLSNLFGKERLEIAAAHVALRTKGAGVAAASDRVLTFGGAPGVTLPPNAAVASDPVRLAVPAGSDLSISLYLRKPAAAGGLHELAQQTSYVGPGDQTAAPELAEAQPLAFWAIVSGVDVVAPPTAAAVAMFGDSFTDGDGSTEDTNRRWPDALA